MTKDIGSGALLLALAAAYAWATLQIPQSNLSDEVGAHGMPLLLATALAAVAVVIIARGALAASSPAVAETADPGSTDETERYESTIPRALGFLAFGALYIVAAWLLGYVPALVLLIGGIALYEGIRPGWQPLAVACGGAVLYWAIFAKLLGTEQPVGLLTGL